MIGNSTAIDKDQEAILGEPRVFNVSMIFKTCKRSLADFTLKPEMEQGLPASGAPPGFDENHKSSIKEVIEKVEGCKLCPANDEKQRFINV